MADPNTRQGKRTPVTLKIKFKSETLEQFIERYAVDVSQGGIFIRTKEPLAVGTQMKFEFQLRDASPLIAGEGTVVWTRENDPSRPAIAPGMGVRFDRLADGSQAVLEKILAEKAKQAPARGGTGGEATTKPPMFTDTPTKVAPAPVQEALGLGSRRARSDSEQTPLPPPRPFHSDADDFDEKAFEEATKVRSLDELAAQTAGLGGGAAEASDDAPTNTAITMPPDELAKRRQGGRPDSLGEPVSPPSPNAAANIDRESAPNLPEPPPARPRGDATPTPRGEDGAKTKLGVEPAKASTKAAAAAEVGSGRKRASETHPPAPSRPSAAPIIILLLVLVAGAAAAVWWFVLRENVADNVAAQPEGSAGSAGSAVAANPGSDGSAGSAGSAAIEQASNGSAGSAGSAVVEAPKGPTVDTVITASVAKGATVEIVGTDQKGPSPFTAKLEKDKAYKARVTAPGFMPTEIDVKGGETKASAKMIIKPHVVAVATDPPGADIYIENVNTQKITPSEVELTAAQAAKPRVRVSLRRPGYRPVDQVVEASAFADGPTQMTTAVHAKLQQIQRPTGGGTTTTNTGGTGTHTGSATGTGSGSGAGSATTPAGTGTGSAATPTGTGSATTTPTGTGTGSATTTTPKPPTGTGTGSATTTPPAGGAGTGSAAKPATGSATPSASTGTGATPSAATTEPAPTWTK